MTFMAAACCGMESDVKIALTCARSMAHGHLGTAPYIKEDRPAMLDDSHYDLLAKYESTEPEFDLNELATIFEILNLEPRTFTETKLQEYRALISQTMHEQARVMTELGGEYLNLDNQGLRIEAMRLVVQNIAKITSPFMLNDLVGLVRHRADSPLNYGRDRRSPVEVERSARVGRTGS
jgi:hypothetical protein